MGTKTRTIPIAAPTVDKPTLEDIQGVLESGMLAQGSTVEAFEQNFAAFIGTRFAVAVNSGTAALQIALLALGVGPEDEVITTPFSFIASANCALYCGARPVFADIDASTYNIDSRLITGKITPKTKIVLPVHLYGQVCDMREIMQLCEEHHLALVEDACQAHGAEYGGKKAGAFGIGCFSFYATKNMTTGEGGMITTDNKDIADRARIIRDQGQKKKYFHDILSYNFRMTNFAAALGIGQLRALNERNEHRLHNAHYLASEVSRIKGLIPPFIAPGRNHVFHQFTIRVTEDFPMTRDELQKKLGEDGIGTGINYPLPIHQQPVYQKLGYHDNLPVAEKAAQQVLSLPVHPEVNDEDLERIVGSIQDASHRNPAR